MDPSEFADSRRKYLWKLVHQLDVLHSELASLYKSSFRDQRRIDIIWNTIDELEMTLLVEGVDYGEYAGSR